VETVTSISPEEPAPDWAHAKLEASIATTVQIINEPRTRTILSLGPAPLAAASDP
jgi:hypothetical protein